MRHFQRPTPPAAEDVTEPCPKCGHDAWRPNEDFEESPLADMLRFVGKSGVAVGEVFDLVCRGCGNTLTVSFGEKQSSAAIRVQAAEVDNE